jgi:hypothetical protein
MRSRFTRVILLIVLVMSLRCTRTVRSGKLIAEYSRAVCIPVRFGPGISPPTRAWDYVLKTAGGIEVQISGAEMPGGRISVKYASDGRTEVAADAGDYIYPADVRFDPAANNLYIKASGVPAAFGRPQTWLFEYDVNHRRQSERVRVDPSVLPEECPAR